MKSSDMMNRMDRMVGKMDGRRRIV